MISKAGKTLSSQDKRLSTLSHWWSGVEPAFVAGAGRSIILDEVKKILSSGGTTRKERPVKSSDMNVDRE